MRAVMWTVAVLLLLVAGVLLWAATGGEGLGWKVLSKNPFLAGPIDSTRETARSMRWLAAGAFALSMLMMTILAAASGRRERPRPDDDDSGDEQARRIRRL
jgi:hypothetical protein